MSELLDEFYHKMQTDYGFSRDEVRAIMKPRFAGFSPEKIPEYVVEIKKVWLSRQVATDEATSKPPQIDWPPCPICGRPTFPHKYYPWACENPLGGYVHYMWWRLNRIREAKGLPPIWYEEHPGAVFPGSDRWRRSVGRSLQTPEEMEAYLKRTQPYLSQITKVRSAS